MSDKIVEEIHAVRKKICEECDYDFQKMGERLMRLQAEHPERLVSEVPKADAEQSGGPKQ
jgi:hypothetical protein